MGFGDIIQHFKVASFFVNSIYYLGSFSLAWFLFVNATNFEAHFSQLVKFVFWFWQLLEFPWKTTN